MLALIQRVSQAKVEVDGQAIGAIGQGLLVLLGVEKDDTRDNADRLLKKVLAYRVFSDAQDKMNLSVQDIRGGLLIVSQFTLAATTDKGLRPGFSSAKPPLEAEQLYKYFLAQAELTVEINSAGSADANANSAISKVACGEFGADMQVSLTNDGPVTFMLKA